MNIRNPALDLLRTIAIFSVLLLHSLDFLNNAPYSLIYIFSYGWIGVDLFFVLSGFLIGSQAFKEEESTKSPILVFIIKRLFRTLPLYYFVFLVYLIIKPMAGYPFNDNPLLYFVFMQNFFSPKDFVQSWSLCIEEQFYFIFPLFFYNFNLKKINPLFWLMPGLLSMLYRHYLYSTGTPADTLPAIAYNYQFPFFTHLDGLSWGIFLASTAHRWQKLEKKYLFNILGIVGLILTLIYIKPSNLNFPSVLSFQLLAISFSAILIGVYDYKKIPFKALFEKIAIYSYGLYLWNNLIAKIVNKVLPQSNGTIKVLIFIIGSFAISIVTYYMIERPSMRLRSKFLKKIS